jgi:prepilin-type N-terminal cleavage/methylation domain-containing protein
MSTRTKRAGRSPATTERRGVTLVELVVVLVILATIAGLALTVVAPASVDARETATRVTLTNVRSAIDGPYRLNLGRVPDRLADLLRKPPGEPAYDAASQTGWNGPYVRVPLARYTAGPSGAPGREDFVDPSFTVDYGATGDPAIHDAYGRPIVLQVPDVDGDGVYSADERRHVRVVSAGPDRVIDTPTNLLFPTLAQCNDDLVLFVTVADQREP